MALAAIAAPVAVLALLALVDLLSGANAHLTRSVLDAGGFGDLADVAQRRLQLSVRSFARPVLLVFLPVALALALLAYLRRDLLGPGSMKPRAARRPARRPRGHRDRHPRQRLRGAPARDRRCLPARLHRVCLGGETRSYRGKRGGRRKVTFMRHTYEISL